jgi:hypothetical protein
MTTLQEIMKEFDEKFRQYYYPASRDGSSWGIDGVTDVEIKSFIEKSYLAGQNSMPQPADVIRLGKELETDAYKKGKEDEKKRVVEIVEGLDLSKITKAELEKAL